MKISSGYTLLMTLMLAALLQTGPAAADDDHANSNPMPCPVVPFDGITPMDVEFQGDVQANTQCLRVRHHAKVIVSVSHPFMVNALNQPQRAKATFFANLDHLIHNYENVHGMTIGKDVEIVVILLETGALLATTEHSVFNASGTTPVPNPFISLIDQARAKGIKIYVCQTAMRNLGLKVSNLIPDLNYVPGGQIAVADFQMRGYGLILP